MAGKKGASRMRSRHSIRGRQENLCDSLFSPSTPPRHDHNFVTSPHAALSLRDEARNTERHSLWSSNVQLRHTQINFVRAEELDANTLTETRNDGRKNGNSMKRAASGPSTRPNTTYPSIEMNAEECKLGDAGKGGQVDIEGLFNALNMPLESTSPPVSREGVFLIDTVGSGRTNTGMIPPVLRSSSPSSSSSCDEVVIFMGRSRTQGRRPSKATSGVASATFPDPLENVFAGPRTIEDHVTMLSPLESDTVRVSALSARSLEENVTLSEPVAAERRVEQTHKKKKRMKRGKKPTGMIRQKNAIEAEDASLADYIANINDGAQQNISIASTPIHRQGLSATGTGRDRRKTESSTSERQAQHSSAIDSRWNISDIEDLEDLSTSDEVLGNIKAVISKRERPSGLQYLVVCEGYTVDDARWIPHTSLESESAVGQIRLYEAEELLQSHYSADDSDTSLRSDGERPQESDTDDELEALSDEEDLLQRRNERLTDEKIARLLAKQEELGMGSNEVMLFDDDFINDITNGDHTKAENVSSTRKKLGSVHHQKKRGKRSMGGAFQQASALANLLDQDHYSGFDIMDHDRPSLKIRPMGRQGAQPFDVSDTDLELSLSSAWHKDRLKKQAKKHEREELRAQGLLGKKNRKKPDLQAKYLGGMTMDQIKDEIKGFISSTNESLPLPPMDKKDRKTVHEIANAFGLKSKSIGGGRTRFPVLYKTSRTSDLSRDSLKVIEARLSRGAFMQRMDKRGKRGPVIPRRRAGGVSGAGAGAGGAAFSYRDGEVVGATAPELGAENKGRAMLERMGWSTGTALGASNNKGILQPVPHVVKTSKAGLG